MALAALIFTIPAIAITLILWYSNAINILISGKALSANLYSLLIAGVVLDIIAIAIWMFIYKATDATKAGKPATKSDNEEDTDSKLAEIDSKIADTQKKIKELKEASS